MARVNAEQANTFPENGRTSFLSLQNDGDSAVVRFAYNTIKDIMDTIDTIHDVMYNGKNRQVDCLRSEGSQPTSLCPLCAAGQPAKRILYFNVRNEQTGEMQVWQRSYSYFTKNMLTLFEEYTKSGTPLCSIPFKIIRRGAKGDTQTTYNLIAMPADNTSLDQFPKDIDPRETGIIKEYDFNTLQNYVATGVFPEKVASSQAEIQPRSNNNQNFGQPARVENYAQQAPMGQQFQQPMQQAPVNNNRRTMMNNNGGY